MGAIGVLKSYCQCKLLKHMGGWVGRGGEAVP